jgi:hypothetical protein
MGGGALDRLRASNPEAVVERMLGPLPASETAHHRDQPPGRDAAVDAALRCLTAKHYLLDGRPVDRAITEGLRHAVAACYDRAAPLRLSISIGCFKSPRLATAPYADWSEFLHLRYMLSRAAELADIHPFGVELAYVLLDLSTAEIAGVSSRHARIYRGSFEALARHLSAGLRPDVRLAVLLLSELVGADEYEARMGKSLARVHEAWRDLPQERIDVEMDKSRRAHLHVGDADDAALEDAARRHMALLSLLPELAYYREPGRVHLLLRKHQGDVQRWLGQKSYRNSIVQFWIGSGCVAVSSDRRCTATILSPNQLAARRLVASIDGFPPPAGNPNLRAVPVYA